MKTDMFLSCHVQFASKQIEIVLMKTSIWCENLHSIYIQLLLSSIFIQINTIVKTWGVVARICCIEVISFMQSLISFTWTSFIRLLLVSFLPTLLSFVWRLFSFTQTAADIDSWLLWIGGGGAWRRSRDARRWICGTAKIQKFSKVSFAYLSSVLCHQSRYGA